MSGDNDRFENADDIFNKDTTMPEEEKKDWIPLSELGSKLSNTARGEISANLPENTGKKRKKPISELKYKTLRNRGYRRRDIPVRTLISGANEGLAKVMVDWKSLPPEQFIAKYGKSAYNKILSFTLADAGSAVKALAQRSSKVITTGEQFAETAGKSASQALAKYRAEQALPSSSATSTIVPQSVVQAPQALSEQTQAQLNERTTLKEAVKVSDERPDNILILQALKAYLDSLSDEYEIDSAIPSSTALRLRRVNGVDILINRALERLSGGDRKKRSRILELLETEKYGTMWGLKSFIEDNPEFDRMISASTNPLSHELLGVKEQSDLEWQPEDSEVELRQLVSGDMLATANRLEALLAESPPQPICPTCGFVQCVCQKATQPVSSPAGRVGAYLRKSPSRDLVWPESSEDEKEEE